MSNEDFGRELDSFENVIGLSPRDPLNGFAEMWYQVFLWCLFSSILVHLVAASIAFGRLRKHKLGRFIPIVFVAMGFLSPLTGGVVTSAAVAGVYRASGFEMAPLYALVWGADGKRSHLECGAVFWQDQYGTCLKHQRNFFTGFGTQHNPVTVISKEIQNLMGLSGKVLRKKHTAI